MEIEVSHYRHRDSFKEWWKNFVDYHDTKWPNPSDNLTWVEYINCLPDIPFRYSYDYSEILYYKSEEELLEFIFKWS